MDNEHFGEHLTIDGYGGDPHKLNDGDLVMCCLGELPKLLQMNCLSKPMVINAPENDIKDPGGWSGFVIIAESHISIHTFPKRKFVSADVYSCKNGMDRKLIEEYFKKSFDLIDLEVNFIKRGVKYPARNIS